MLLAIGSRGLVGVILLIFYEGSFIVFEFDDVSVDKRDLERVGLQGVKRFVDSKASIIIHVQVYRDEPGR
jgi:hypothetical protein